MDVRSSLILLALATASPAVACPQGALCAAVGDAPREEVPAPARTLSLRVDAIADRAPWRLDAAAPRSTADDMPWIWQLLRREVMGRMPRYRDDSFTFVLSPVVVTGSFDTVPGIGLAGDF